MVETLDQEKTKREIILSLPKDKSQPEAAAGPGPSVKHKLWVKLIKTAE